MELFCTSVMTPAFKSDPLNIPPRMLYFGTDKSEALRVVPAGMEPSDSPPPTGYPKLYCALPVILERTVIRYFKNGATWCSVVSITIEEN